MSAIAFNKGNAERALKRRIEQLHRELTATGDTVEFYECPTHRCICRIPAAEFEAADRPEACPHHAISWIRFNAVAGKRPYQKKVRKDQP